MAMATKFVPTFLSIERRIGAGDGCIELSKCENKWSHESFDTPWNNGCNHGQEVPPDPSAALPHPQKHTTVQWA